MKYFNKTFARFYKVSVPFEWQGHNLVVIQPFHAHHEHVAAIDASENNNLLVTPLWHCPDTPQVKDASFMTTGEGSTWELLPCVDETQCVPQLQRSTLIYPVFGSVIYDLEQDGHLLMTSDSKNQFSIFRILRVLAPDVAEVSEFNSVERAIMVYVPIGQRYVVGTISYSRPIKLHPSDIKTISEDEHVKKFTVFDIEGFCKGLLMQNYLYHLPSENVSFVVDNNRIVWIFTSTNRWRITQPMLEVAWKDHNFDFDMWKHASSLVIDYSSNHPLDEAIKSKAYVILGSKPC